jgi:hypothetical protein
MKIDSFSTLFGLLFSIVGIMLGLWITFISTNKDYDYFFIYSSISGFLTAKLLAKYVIERRNDFSQKNLLIVSILTGLMSHWLCWYMINIGLNFRYWILGEHFFSPPVDPLSGILWVFNLCLFSWIIVGWATVLGGVISIYSSQWIYDRKITKNN